ncbi:FtsX-like permease family protein [Bifidobacterium vespertilionis]|uniref:FtsX-like permease family protein n=1 Tax=Bifidobacterium vespertilionis TaxID=2562524 RepID=UPI001F0AD811|nr:FtsX-like permease family protein [Bifidobacterium vespertilionis]
MNRAMVKDTLRMWLRAWKRFASIAMISLLGVAVLTGIYAGCRDTFLAADRFYDAQRLTDVQVLSTLGLTDDDVAALRAVEGVESVQPERSQSVTVSVNGSDKSATITEIGADGLNQPRLERGRMPSKAGEVAVTDKFIKDSGLDVGATLSVTADADDEEDADGDASDDTGDASSESAPSFPTELTITGVVLDPKDLSNPYGYAGTNFRNTAASDYAFFAPGDGVTGNVYTAISLTVSGAADLDTFSARYDATVKTVADRIRDSVQTDRQTARRQSLVDEAQRKLDDAKRDAAAQFDDAERQINDQQATLDENKKTLSDTRTELEGKQDDLADGRAQIADARTKIANGRKQLEDAQQEIVGGYEQVNGAKKPLADARAQLEDGKRQLADGRRQAQDGLDQVDRTAANVTQLRGQVSALAGAPGPIDPSSWQPIAAALGQLGISVPQDPAQIESFDPILNQLDGVSGQLGAQRDQINAKLDAIGQQEAALAEQDAQLTAKERELADNERKLDGQQATVTAQLEELDRQSATLDDKAKELKDGQTQLDDGFRQLSEGETQLADGQRKLDDARGELASKRADADAEFAKQQGRIDDIGEARWYVQTRSSIGGFNALDSDLSSIESIGRAFPVVFLLVAALMSLTTMTRMVEEDRGLIGTYTGLGYGGAAIAMRYVLFALLACLVGGGIGLAVGFLGIPAFLKLVIDEMYMVPDVRLEYDWTVGTLGVGLFVVCVLAATLVACAGEMRQTPAALMRPKAPRAGARILLERIRPVWRRLSFLNKVAARNIFRFKSRLVMTVLGVAGCTALIVCGLAINDTVDTLGPRQYEGLYQYDALVVAPDDKADAMRQRVADDGRAAETLDVRLESGEITNEAGGSGTIQLIAVPDGDAARLGDMVALNRVEGDHGEVGLEAGGFDDSGSGGVIVEQSVASALGIRDGQTVTLADGQGRRAQATVAAVTRNLIGSNVYMTESLYRSLFAAGGPSDAEGESDAGGSSRAASTVTLNAVFARLDGDADARIDYVKALGQDPNVLRAISCDELERNFQFDLMAAVVALITLLAGLLALVVLFTLANTNVSERVREMATLKVLGFFDREVHLYVNKEMTILTLMGIAVGLPLGRFVGGLLTAAINMSGLYFEVQVRPASYAIAAAATLGFALVVQLLTNPVLDRIDPVSSLKSVE